MAGHNRLIGSLAHLAIALSVSLVFHSCGSGKGDSTESFNLAELTQDGVEADSGAATATAVSSDDRFNPFAKHSGTDAAASAQDGDLVNQSIAPPPPPKPKLHVSLTDLGLDVVESLHLTFTKVDVEFTPTGGSVQTVTIFEGERTEDLISLSKGLLKGLGSVTLDPGVVTQIRLITKSAEIKFKDEEVTRPVTVPSGDETGLKLIGNIPLEMGKEIELVIDFDVEKSVHVTGSPTDPKVMLKPTLKIFSLNELHELDNLPEGNHKVLLSAVTDEKDPFSPGLPDWRPSRRPDQDIDFQVDVRETGELKPGPSETTYFTWRVSVASHQQGNTPGLVREYSDIQCLAGVDCPDNTLPSPMKFNVHVDFSGRETDADATTAFTDGLYIYVVNTAVVITKAGKEPQGKGNPKGKGKGPIKRDPNMEPGRDEMRVVDRDKFYGSLRIDSRSPEVTNLAPIHRYIFSHATPKHTLMAVDPIDGEESFSGLNIATWKQFLNGKDLINLNLLPVTVELKEPERFASRGPDRVFQQIRSATLATTPYGVQEGLNKLTGEIEDNAENLGRALDSTRTVEETQFFVDTQKPIVAWSKPPDGFITNNPIVESIFDFDDPKPSSGMRTSTMFIKYYNNHTGWTLNQGIGDVAFTILEETEPFPGGGTFPRVTTARLTPMLPDGNYTLLGKVADRATVSGNPNDPPVNFSEHTVDFCVDTKSPAAAILSVGGAMGGGAVSSLDPTFSVNCTDPFPSCGLANVTLIAVRTHIPAPSPQVGPIPIGAETCSIPLPVSVCGSGATFQVGAVATTSTATRAALQLCYAGTSFIEGVYDFTLQVSDQASNSRSGSIQAITLDVTSPITLSFGVKSANGGDVTGPYTSAPRPFKVIADYHNGLSGINVGSVNAHLTCFQGCSTNPLGPVTFDGEIATPGKSTTHAEGSFDPCEGINHVTFSLKDYAGNAAADARQFCADFQPPILSNLVISSVSGGKQFELTASDVGTGIAFLALVNSTNENIVYSALTHLGGNFYRVIASSAQVATQPTILARDQAGNIARLKISTVPASGGGEFKTDQNTSIVFPTGAIPAGTIVTVGSLNKDQVRSILGPGFFSSPPGEFYAGFQVFAESGVPQAFGRAVIPVPAGFVNEPNLKPVLVLKCVPDGCSTGASRLQVVDIATVQGSELKGSDPNAIGISFSAVYVVAKPTESIRIIKMNAPGAEGKEVRLKEFSPGFSNIFYTEVFDNGYFLLPAPNTTAQDQMVEVVDIPSGELWAEHTIPSYREAGVSFAGICDTTIRPLPPTFPLYAQGGPPDQFNAADEFFPATPASEGGNWLNPTFVVSTGNPNAVKMRVVLSGETAGAPFSTDIVSTNFDTFNNAFIFGPVNVAGFTTSVMGNQSRTLHLDAYVTIPQDSVCTKTSPVGRKSITTKLILATGPYAEGFGVQDRPEVYYAFHGPGASPRQCFDRDAKPGCNPGPIASEIGCGGVPFGDPNSCKPILLQENFMKLARAGVRWSRIEFIWRHHQPNGPSDSVTFDDRKGYAVMAKEYGVSILGMFLSATTPYWASSCCIGASEGSCKISTDQYQTWYETVRAPHTGSTDIFTSLTPSTCSPIPARLNVKGQDYDYGHFINFVSKTLDTFLPLGVKAWEIGNESHGGNFWVVRRDLSAFIKPAFTGPIPEYRNPVTGITESKVGLVVSPSEYKNVYLAAYDYITSVCLDCVVVTSGVNTAGDNDCPDWSLGATQNTRLGCLRVVDSQKFLDALRQGGRDVNFLDRAVIGIHAYDYSCGPSTSVDPGCPRFEDDKVGQIPAGFALATAAAAKFPDRDIWSTEHGWKLSRNPLDLGLFDPNNPFEVPEHRLAGYLAASYNYLAVIPRLKKMFYYQWPDLGDNFGLYSGWCQRDSQFNCIPGTATHRAIQFPNFSFNAYSPPLSIPVRLQQTYEVRTGLDRGAVLSRAYFLRHSGVNSTVRVVANATHQFTMTRAKLNPDGSPAGPFVDLEQECSAVARQDATHAWATHYDAKCFQEGGTTYAYAVVPLKVYGFGSGATLQGDFNFLASITFSGL